MAFFEKSREKYYFSDIADLNFFEVENFQKVSNTCRNRAQTLATSIRNLHPKFQPNRTFQQFCHAIFRHNLKKNSHQRPKSSYLQMTWILKNLQAKKAISYDAVTLVTCSTHEYIILWEFETFNSLLRVGEDFLRAILADFWKSDFGVYWTFEPPQTRIVQIWANNFSKVLNLGSWRDLRYRECAVGTKTNFLPPKLTNCTDFSEKKIHVFGTKSGKVY